MSLQEDIGKWGADTFGATSTQAQKKLQQEFKEFDDALTTLHDYHRHRFVIHPDNMDKAFNNLEEEAADVLILLFQIGYFCDFDVIEAAKRKFEENKDRTWSKQPDGTFQHV